MFYDLNLLRTDVRVNSCQINYFLERVNAIYVAVSVVFGLHRNDSLEL